MVLFFYWSITFLRIEIFTYIMFHNEFLYILEHIRMYNHSQHQYMCHHSDMVYSRIHLFIVEWWIVSVDVEQQW